MKKYYVSGGNEIYGDIKTCAENEAKFFTLYKREKTGLSHAVAYFANRENAEIVMATFEQRDFLQQASNALAAEVDALKAAHKKVVSDFEKTISQLIGESNSLRSTYPLPATPEHDVYLNSVRADAVSHFWNRSLRDVAHVLSDINAFDDKSEAADVVHSEIKERVDDFLESLRSGTHDTADNAKDAERASLTALPVERDQYGYWSHPDYLAFCDGREYIHPTEFNQWMESKGLEWTVDYRDEEEIEPDVDGYDLSAWNPKEPAGDGWFVGSIHDTEDGAVCIWLRAKAGL